MKLCLTTAFLLLLLRGFPQSFAEKIISVEPIGISNGLSQGMINCIFQDHYGFMWFGTMDGLNRYDGYNFKIFRNDPLNNTSISGNFITSILEDSKGRLWIGTALNGLNLFCWETEQFTHFSTHSKPSLSDNTIFSIQEDKNGTIWIGTQSGLNKLSTESDPLREKTILAPGIKASNTSAAINIQPISLKDASGNELFTTKDKYEPSFYITKSGIIWVSASGSIFKILPSKTGTEKIIKEDMAIYGLSKKDGKSFGIIVKITEDTTNGILCMKGENFFIIINEKTGISRCGIVPHLI